MTKKNRQSVSEPEKEEEGASWEENESESESESEEEEEEEQSKTSTPVVPKKPSSPSKNPESESESEEEEEGQPKTSIPKKPSSPPKKPESEEEERKTSTPVVPKKSSSPPKKPVPFNADAGPGSDESESDSRIKPMKEEAEEEEEEEEEAPPKATEKPPVAKPSTPAKRQAESKVKNSNRESKRTKKSENMDEEEAEEEESEEELGKKAGDDVSRKQVFGRFWSEADELKILNGMIGYAAKKGKDVASDMNDFHKFIKKVKDASKAQLSDKVRRLKKKYFHNAQKNGGNPTFVKLHDKQVFDLSQEIWGGEAAAAKIDIDIDNNDVFAAKGGTKMTTQVELHVGQIDNIAEEIVMNGFNFISGPKKAELEKKWKGLRVEEVELYLKKLVLISDQTKLILEALKSPGH